MVVKDQIIKIKTKEMYTMFGSNWRRRLLKKAKQNLYTPGSHLSSLNDYSDLVMGKDMIRLGSNKKQNKKQTKQMCMKLYYTNYGDDDDDDDVEDDDHNDDEDDY